MTDAKDKGIALEQESVDVEDGDAMFRLAEQADKLAVFNPIFPGRETGGVANEVTFASSFGHSIYVYQAPELDPDNRCDVWLSGFGTGTMGTGPSGQLKIRKSTIDELFAAFK